LCGTQYQLPSALADGKKKKAKSGFSRIAYLKFECGFIAMTDSHKSEISRSEIRHPAATQ
jgi:hypothetical protein